MAVKLTGSVGSRRIDDILIGTTPTAHVETLELKEDSGSIYERGTVLVCENGTGDPKPVSKAITPTDVIYVLAETADVSEGDNVAEAYTSGMFARQKLQTDGSYELTRPDYEYMRQAGLPSKALLVHETE